jgi:hypothetical protein
VILDYIPVGCWHKQDRQLPVGHILLMRKSLIARNENVEAFTLGCSQKLTIADAYPAHIGDSERLMFGQ